MWLHLRSRGRDVARCTIERLYVEQGWTGALRARTYRTTIPVEAHERPMTWLIGPALHRDRPESAMGRRLHLCRDLRRAVFVAFVFDVFSRMIVGWRAATSMTTDLVIDTLEIGDLEPRPGRDQ
jgi:putative transposase